MRKSVDRLKSSLTRGTRAAVSPVILRGVGREAVATGAHLALYPLGVLREKFKDAEHRYSLDHLPPLHRGLLIGDVEAAGTPIVLVHGWVDNRAVWTFLRRALRRRGFGRVVTLNYNVATHDVRRAAASLGRLVDRVCDETGYERVHVVGHSMGGVVARYYVQRYGGDAHVHTLVTLGTPHGGTRAAHLPLGKAVRQMRPSSDIVRELAEPAPGCRTRFVSFWSDLDHLVLPARAACIEHPDLVARNVLVRGVGHLSLPLNSAVVHEIASMLSYLDAAGTTITAGVTALTQRPDAAVDSPAAPQRARDAQA